MAVLQEIKDQLDSSCSADSNLQHLIHMFEGYRSWHLLEGECPYSPDSPRQRSWAAGWKMAENDEGMDSGEDGPPFYCRGCGREELTCSKDPCPDVIKDRES